MTEEQIKQKSYKYARKRHCTKCHKKESCGDYYCPIIAYCTQAYITSAKENGNVWHKVADGDLPKEKNLYLVAMKDNGLAIAYFNGMHWETKYNMGDFGHLVETVIAWCEIPKFEVTE